jgi:hemerythrin-like domain-containing protein
MTEPVALWHAEHLNFVRLLDLLDKEVAGFYKGGRPNYVLMGDIVYYLTNYSDKFHHPREDAAFEFLVKQDESAESVVDRLRQEHRVIALAGEELAQRIAEAENDVLTSRERLEVAAATYLLYYRHHIATEEKEILPRAAKSLTAQDWARVEDSVAHGHDPLFGGAADARLRALRHEISSQARLAAVNG